MDHFNPLPALFRTLLYIVKKGWDKVKRVMIYKTVEMESDIKGYCAGQFTSRGETETSNIELNNLCNLIDLVFIILVNVYLLFEVEFII